ncbi:MAG TPA: hypothetical protein VFZ78_06400, partial [Flavisolibacter sp.]
MRVYQYLIVSCLIFASLTSGAQKIIYSEPDHNDTRRINFEIIGKVSGNFLIYKNIRDRSYISVYNNDMEQVARELHDYVPQERLINVDFFPYADHAYMVYQYQKRNVVYCKAVKVDGNGRKASQVITIDTSHIGFASTNRIYSAITSENRENIMLYKINARNKSRYIITTLLLNDTLGLKKRTRFLMPMEEYNDHLDEFSLDNDGNLVFAKVRRAGNETISETKLIWKKADQDTLTEIPVTHTNMYLDEPHIKIDNVNRRYFLTSFFYRQRRGNIEGFYFYVWDRDNERTSLENAVELGEDVRKEARGGSSVRTAFNDFFIRNIIIKKDGGFLINTESYYTSSRIGSWNRWNYLYGTPTTFDYYTAYSPYSSLWWRNRNLNPQAVRHHADNLMILSFDNTGKLQWNNVIHKDQYDDET